MLHSLRDRLTVEEAVHFSSERTGAEKAHYTSGEACRVTGGQLCSGSGRLPS